MRERFHKIVYNTQIYVWEITLSSIDLATHPLLNSEDLISAGNIKNEKRKKEFLSSRIALKKTFNKSLELKHLESGRPTIDEAEYISISHSSNFLAMAFGKENIGIDIEKPQNRMLKMMPKILSEREQLEFNKTPSIDLACKLWGTKEAILKHIGNKNLNYKNDINVEYISSGKAKYLTTNFNVMFEKIEAMILTYVVRFDT